MGGGGREGEEEDREIMLPWFFSFAGKKGFKFYYFYFFIFGEKRQVELVADATVDY